MPRDQHVDATRRGLLGAVGAGVTAALAGCAAVERTIGAPKVNNLEITLHESDVFTRAEATDGETGETICVDGSEAPDIDFEKSFPASRVWLAKGSTTQLGVRSVRVVYDGAAISTVDLKIGEYRTPPLCMPPGENLLIALNADGEAVATVTAEVKVVG